MRTNRPIIYDRNRNIVGFLEQEPTPQLMEELRKKPKETIKKIGFTPKVEVEVEVTKNDTSD